MYSVFESLLKEKGITAYKVSKDTGISTATLTQWKQGKITPKADKMQRIANYLGVSLQYLMTGVDTGEKMYYFTAETAETAQEIFDDPDLRALFDAAKDCPPEVLRSTAALLRQLKKTNPDG